MTSNSETSPLSQEVHQADITIKGGQPLHRLSPWIYGQFLEHINNSLDLGIHAEMLTERSFEMASAEIPSIFLVPAYARPGGRRGGLDPDFPVFHWSSTIPSRDALAYRKRPGVFRDPLDFSLIGKTANKALGIVEGQRGELEGEADAEGAPNGERYLRMTLHEDFSSPEGIRQEFVPSRKGEELDGFVFLRCVEGGGPVEVGLRPRGGGTSYAKAVLPGISPKWKKYNFRFTPDQTDLDAEFYLAASGKGTYHIDLISLMPLAKRNSPVPFRDDLIEACRRLKPAIIRWPGGCFVNVYDWKSGIGPYDQRRPVRTYDWGTGGETEPCTFGTDEFVAFCRLVGAEPLIVFDVIKGVQDALDWIEYCNGPVTSPWGAKRAANGHPEPHNVSCWGADNERWDFGYDKYCSLTNEILDAIRERYPHFQIWTVGTGQPLEKPQDPDSRSNWGPEVVRRTGNRSDFNSFHNYYGSGLAENLSFEEDFRREAAAFRKAVPEKNIQISFDEWMPSDALTLRGGLLCALAFNSIERCGDIVGMAAPAPWLWHQRLGTIAPNTLIHHDHRGWFPTPLFLVNELWANHYGSEFLETLFAGPTMRVDLAVRNASNEAVIESREVPVLDISTTRDPESERVVLKVVNRDLEHAVSAKVHFQGAKTFNEGTWHLIHDSNLDAANTMDHPEGLKVQANSCRPAAEGWHFDFPAHSASLIVFMS